MLVEAFPDPFGREDVEILRRNLLEGSWTSGDQVCRYHLIVACDDSQVLGGTSFYFFSHGVSRVTSLLYDPVSDVRERFRGNSLDITDHPEIEPETVSRDHTALGIGAYLGVRKRFRGKGIGTKLITLRDKTLARDAQELNCLLKGLIIQVSDPGLMSAEEIEQDSMNPWKRERFWKRRGYRKIDFNFIQPPIRIGEPPVEYLSLYMFPYCPEWQNMRFIPRSDLHDIVDSFVKCTGTPGPQETDPSYMLMRSELAERDEWWVMGNA